MTYCIGYWYYTQFKKILFMCLLFLYFVTQETIYAWMKENINISKESRITIYEALRKYYKHIFRITITRYAKRFESQII